MCDTGGAVQATFNDRPAEPHILLNRWLGRVPCFPLSAAAIRRGTLDQRSTSILHQSAFGYRCMREGIHLRGRAMMNLKYMMVDCESRRSQHTSWKPRCSESIAGVSAVKRRDITELHYICPIATVPSILERGILSHEAAQGVAHQSIANEEVQARRARVRIPGGKRLHGYVNLYLNGRNPMMFTVCKTAGADRICLLRVNPDVMDSPGVVLTDRNASSIAVRFSDPAGGLGRLDADLIFARYWTDPDYFRQSDKKSRMCAEVLVPSIVNAEMIVGAYVSSMNARQALRQLAAELPVSVDRYKFFG